MDKELQFKKEFINLYSELNLSTLLDKIADKICDYLNCEESSIFLYDSIKEELFFEIATGRKKEELKKIVLKKGEGLVGWVAEHDKSVIVNDCARDPRFTAIADEKTNINIKEKNIFFICRPLVFLSQVVFRYYNHDI